MQNVLFVPYKFTFPPPTSKVNNRSLMDMATFCVRVYLLHNFYFLLQAPINCKSYGFTRVSSVCLVVVDRWTRGHLKQFPI